MTKKLIIFMPSIEGGGVEKNLFIVSNYLARHFNDVTLITASKSYNKKFQNIKILNPIINVEFFKGRKIKYFFCLITLFFYQIKNTKTLTFAFQANLYCIILCKILGRKVITRSNSSPAGWSKNPLKFFIYKKLLSLADSIMVNSEDFKKEFFKKFKIKTTCIYNPLNKKEILSKSKIKVKNLFSSNKKVKAINIGRFVDQKNQITILKAINYLKIKNKIKNFELILMGRGIDEMKLKNYTKKNRLEKIVKFINFKSNPYPYLKQANLFILSSKFEGLPNVLLEAATLKKYIISTNCPTGPREILKNGLYGDLYKVGDYKKLSKIIERFKINSFYLKKINNNFKDLKRFDYHKNLEKYLIFVKKNLN